MITVNYTALFGYLYAERHDRFPGLPVQVQNPNSPDQAVDVQAHLDSGAEFSLFDGWIAGAIGVDLLDGPVRRYAATRGEPFEARVHRVVLFHPDLGVFPLAIGFSAEEIRRNLLGRDFLNFIQIGFRERHLEFYVAAVP